MALVSAYKESDSHGPPLSGMVKLVATENYTGVGCVDAEDDERIFLGLTKDGTAVITLRDSVVDRVSTFVDANGGSASTFYADRAGKLIKAIP